jgi:hypothetical protein
MKGKKQERPLGLDLPFDEALRRFIGTDKAEVEENIKRAKEKREPPEPPPPEVDGNRET